MHYWLLKTEPETYSWADLVRDKTTEWSGVRNFQARNNMKAMKKGDLAFMYHSGKEKAIKGITKIVREAHDDSSAKEPGWIMVDVVVVKPVTKSITLDAIKKNPALKNMVLVNNSRLSVQPVKEEEWEECLRMAETVL